MFQAWFAVPLRQRVLGGLVLELIFALVWPAGAPYVAVIGELFVRAIRMLVAPIVLVAITAGITMLADPKRLGSPGGRTIGLFAVTTFVAVSVGMLVATLVRPGVGAPLGGVVPKALGPPVMSLLLFDRLLDMTRNVPSASANLAMATTVARWEGELAW